MDKVEKKRIGPVNAQLDKVENKKENIVYLDYCLLWYPSYLILTKQGVGVKSGQRCWVVMGECRYSIGIE